MGLERRLKSGSLRQNRFSVLSAAMMYLMIGCGTAEQTAHKKDLGQYCLTDSSCDGQLVCENQRCVSDKGGYCSKDTDCSGLYVCSNNSCVSSGNSFDYKDVKGSNNSDVYNSSLVPVAKTPQEAYSLFKGALGKGDRETMLYYISPHVQNRYKGFFDAMSSSQLQQLAQEMPSLDGVKPTYQSPTNNFVEYNVIVNNEEFAIIFKCEKNGVCTINGF